MYPLTILVCFAIVSSSFVIADELVEEWVIVEDGSAQLQDTINDSITDSSGNTYVTGCVNVGNNIATLSTAKYDNGGNKLWENIYHVYEKKVY